MVVAKAVVVVVFAIGGTTPPPLEQREAVEFVEVEDERVWYEEDEMSMV